MNGKIQEALVIFKFWPELHTRTLAEIFKIDKFWQLPSFAEKLSKSVKMIKFECKHDLQVFSWWMEEKLNSFSHFKILTKIGYPDLSRNLQIDSFWSLSSLTVKLWKSVKMMKFKCKDDLQVFSWWMEKN